MEYIARIRSALGSERILIPATALVLINELGEVLLHMRGRSGDWGLPGGLMDIGETVIESVMREAKEETGLAIESPELFGVFSGTKHEVDYPDGNKTAPMVLAFYSKEYSGTLETSAESPQLGFFSFQDLPKNMNRHHLEFIRGFHQFQKEKAVVFL